MKIPYTNTTEKASFFTCGGLVFVPNPFDEHKVCSSEITTEMFDNFYKKAKTRDIEDLNLDDIADIALLPLTDLAKNASVRRSV